MKIVLKCVAMATLLASIAMINSCKDDENTPIPPATVAGFSPSRGQIGSEVVITGSFFETNTADNVVKFNGVKATITAATATELTVTVPNGATTGKITISVREATTTTTSDFTVVLKPTISSFTPEIGTYGNTVEITGTNFDTDKSKNTVTFNGVATTVTKATATELRVRIPVTATTGKIAVTVDNMTATSETDFIIVPFSITSFNPTNGIFGTEITITGENFDANVSGNIVKLNGVQAEVVSATTTELKVSLSNGGSTGKISVTVDEVTAESDDDFTYTRKWFVSDFAGNGQTGTSDGTGANASFSNMGNVAIDSAGNVYVADAITHLIRKISPQAVVTTIAGTTEGYQDGPIATAKLNVPAAIAVDASGDVYVADSFNNMIRKISNGQVSTVAGTGEPGLHDGEGDEATFNNPHGVCVDSHGNLFVADNHNHSIRKITPAGIVSTFVGNGQPGSDDGTGTDAMFNSPWGLTIDKNDNIYVAETMAHNIRHVTPDGVVTTLAGHSTQGSTDGPGTEATFYRPTGVSADYFGNVFVCDQFNSTVRMINSDGVVTTIAGSALVEGYENGIGEDALFVKPYSVTNNAAGNIIYVADQGNRKVRKMVLK